MDNCIYPIHPPEHKPETKPDQTDVDKAPKDPSMASSLSLANAAAIPAICRSSSSTSTGSFFFFTKRSRARRTKTQIRCIGWDPEGLLGPPQTGHIARREFKRRLDRDAEAREAFQRQIFEEKERRLALRQSRIAPDTPAEVIEYFLDTEAQEIEFEIARLRPRLDKEFFSHLQFELGQLRFAVSKTQDMEDRLIELEALQKALLEGTEAYDKMQAELVKARESLTKILMSKDVKATLLDMVERNELNRSLLALLDENIANAHKGDQKQAAAFMEKVRGAMLKYMTA